MKLLCNLLDLIEIKFHFYKYLIYYFTKLIILK